MQIRNEMCIVHLKASHILLAVANHYDVGIEQLKGSSRRKGVVWPRFVACWLMYKMLGYSTLRIGRILGDRDHTTVMNALNRVEDVMDRGTNEKHPEDVAREIDTVGELSFRFAARGAIATPERDIEAECRAW